VDGRRAVVEAALTAAVAGIGADLPDTAGADTVAPAAIVLRAADAAAKQIT
jgi:hypothetical protein